MKLLIISYNGILYQVLAINITAAEEAIERLMAIVNQATTSQGSVEIDMDGKIVDPDDQKTGKPGTMVKINPFR